MLLENIKSELEDGDIVTLMNKEFVEMVGIFVDNNQQSQVITLRNVHFVNSKLSNNKTKIEKIDSYSLTPLYKTVENFNKHITVNIMDGTFLKVEKSSQQSEIKSIIEKE